jgi:hypothetical protein
VQKRAKEAGKQCAMIRETMHNVTFNVDIRVKGKDFSAKSIIFAA